MSPPQEPGRREAPPAPVALAIAGSDSSGGAGIEADLRTFAAFGVHGAAAITAVTAQDTRGVRAIHAVPPRLVRDQIEAVLDDLSAGAVKTGMLHSAETIETVAACLRGRGLPLVLDPVMASASGERLLQEDAVGALRRLLPLARLVTPNLAEAAILAGRPARTLEEMREAARSIADLGAAAVLVKGGHLPGEPTDLLLERGGFLVFPGERVPGRGARGTGCTLSAAIAALLARGTDLPVAVRRAKEYVARAIRRALPLGKGRRILGPFPGDRDGE